VDQLLSLFLILNDKSVKVSSTSDLEFSLAGSVLLYGSRLDVLSAGVFEEELDILKFFSHCYFS